MPEAFWDFRSMPPFSEILGYHSTPWENFPSKIKKVVGEFQPLETVKLMSRIVTTFSWSDYNSSLQSLHMVPLTLSDCHFVAH